MIEEWASKHGLSLASPGDKPTPQLGEPGDLSARVSAVLSAAVPDVPDDGFGDSDDEENNGKLHSPRAMSPEEGKGDQDAASIGVCDKKKKKREAGFF